MSQDPGPRPGQSSLRHIPPRLGSLVQRSALLALGRRSLLLCNHSRLRRQPRLALLSYPAPSVGDALRHGLLHLSETDLGCIVTKVERTAASTVLPEKIHKAWRTPCTGR